MSITKYEDGLCEYTTDTSEGVVLYHADLLEIYSDRPDGSESTRLFIPDWLAKAIREAFIKKIEEEKDKSA